ncbi:uncharacterized protein [Periplaneta americana]|uniref:uncharacterized protein isoform X1 n=1 Tax=Periplaneta americana TaxID=6978 RepID=UPI0037E769BB
MDSNALKNIPLITKEEHFKVPFEVTYSYPTGMRDEWLDEPHQIVRKYYINNSNNIYTEVKRIIHGENQLHTDYSLVLPCGNTEILFLNSISTHEDTHHSNTCLGNGEHLIECRDPCESHLRIWRELCDPSCLTYKEKPESVDVAVKAPRKRYYRERCEDTCPNYKPKPEIVKVVVDEEKKANRKNRFWRENCIETCPNHKAQTIKRGKRKREALKEETTDVEDIIQHLTT